ncbi:unnamed protein product [Dibothriocephalus latus]|uniref:PDZ domain-containing protein n=1 Tax=Dibothriocephalus latus TaxID=60516 RepID=A0A3P6TAL3_DIBLA|nr:unnamed protein product [Dibothriocephalus latus]
MFLSGRCCALWKWSTFSDYGFVIQQKADTFFILLIEKDSPAAFGRLLRGDIILAVNESHIYNEVAAWIAADKEKVELLVCQPVEKEYFDKFKIILGSTSSYLKFFVAPAYKASESILK